MRNYLLLLYISRVLKKSNYFTKKIVKIWKECKKEDKVVRKIEKKEVLRYNKNSRRGEKDVRNMGRTRKCDKRL